eukprot:TRINITY_DN21480_c0_g2_i1.p1 TRINITY_DN21480_c0_g2~~TRINITY_DN21480_c0_g2_i1.p1  ORF type:complete len:235 (+),score=48.40 TRINITY_DN21480_c0_g2_i1:225-929(+)
MSPFKNACMLVCLLGVGGDAFHARLNAYDASNPLSRRHAQATLGAGPLEEMADLLEADRQEIEGLRHLDTELVLTSALRQSTLARLTLVQQERMSKEASSTTAAAADTDTTAASASSEAESTVAVDANATQLSTDNAELLRTKAEEKKAVPAAVPAHTKLWAALRWTALALLVVGVVLLQVCWRPPSKASPVEMEKTQSLGGDERHEVWVKHAAEGNTGVLLPPRWASKTPFHR